MRTLLITGGAGFIGTNVAVYFLDRGWRVTIFDDLSRKGSGENLRWLAEKYPTGWTFYRINIVGGAAERNFFAKKAGEADVILHAAAQVAVTSSVVDPVFDFETNARGTLNVLEAARKSPRKPIVIFTSTNKVYGELEHLEIGERERRYIFADKLGVSENEPLDFHSPYGCSKGAADQYVHDYHRIYGLPTVVFRQSCIYGYRQFGIVDQGWVAYLTARAMLGLPITIYGDGKQVRDILFMSDLCEAMSAAIEKIDVSAGRIYNVGGGPQNTVSLLEFLERLENEIGQKIGYSFSEWRPGDQKVYISDIGKARRDLGWSPQVVTEDGIKKMIAWTGDNLELLSKYM